MSWRLSKALMTLRGEVNEEHPNRSKISDGTIGDLAHAARTSDHNPDENGLVHAWDCTADPVLHVAQKVVDFLTTGPIDKRLKYVIWQGRIFSKRFGRWAWRPYTGTNPHDHHAHISIYGDDGAPWGYPTSPSPQPSEFTVNAADEAKIREIVAAQVAPLAADVAEIKRQVTQSQDANAPKGRTLRHIASSLLKKP